MSSAAPAVEVSGLGREFRRGREVVTALRDISFQLGEGEVVGLLGANGAGKTTLTKIIATLLLPTAGSVRIFGADAVRQPRTARAVTGTVLGGERGLYGHLTGRENIEFFAMLSGIHRRALGRRVRRALQEFGLAEAASRPVETYSRGMRQRLHLAIGLIDQPRLLLLDEPTNGLDPVEAERIRTVIAGLRDSGVTVLLTSHYLLDIERLADRVLLIDAGRLTGDLAVSQFRQLAGYAGVVTVHGRGTPPPVLSVPSDGLTVMDVRADGNEWTARIRVQRWGGELFSRLGQLLYDVPVTDLQVAPVQLDDVYASLIWTEVETLRRG
jgi:ABC-2 type transport system ATP-binding protein